MPSTASVIAEAVKEALSLWKTFIETRQQAYNRAMDKKMRLALNVAESAFREVYGLFALTEDSVPETKRKEYDRIKAQIDRQVRKFNRLD